MGREKTVATHCLANFLADKISVFPAFTAVASPIICSNGRIT